MGDSVFMVMQVSQDGPATQKGDEMWSADGQKGVLGHWLDCIGTFDTTASTYTLQCIWEGMMGSKTLVLPWVMAFRGQ